MTKIVVFGANGTAGRRIVQEALSRGDEVTAVVRHPESAHVPGGAQVVKGDALSLDSVRDVLPGADAVIIAIAAQGTKPWREAAENIVRAASELDPKPYVVHMGGGASLLAPDGSRFVDSPDFPDAYRNDAEGQIDAHRWYLAHAGEFGVDWTFMSPPPVNFAPGERSGSYRTGLDEPVVDAQTGEAHASYEDAAQALVDEAEARAFAGRRFTIGR